MKNTTVEVTTKAEADELLKEAFPGYQEVKDVGPLDAAGARRGREMRRFQEGGAYLKDYAVVPETRLVRGHASGNVHGRCPHANIKSKDGVKVTINIVGRR